MTGLAIYRPLDPALDQIRVLHILPGEGAGDPIRAELETMSLQSDPAPQYEAISYCWGGANGCEAVIIRGKKVEIPASSVKVLQRFRYTDKPRTVWIDAICINQTDFAERAQQVMLMGQVYSKSIHTLIWLGEANDTTERAAHCIQNNAGLMRQMLQACEGDTKAVEAAFAATKIERDPANVLAIENFFNAAWFTRVWVSQEALLSAKATCYCGDSEVSWNDVCLTAYAEGVVYRSDFGSGLQSGASRAHAGISKAHQGLVWIERRENEIIPCLGVFLASGRELHATNPRDYFYGLLGFPAWLQKKESLPKWFEVDYSKPVSCVLQDATRLAIAEAKDLEIFEYLDGYEPDKLDSIASTRPSWAPPWDTPPSIQSVRFSGLSTYRASGSHKVDEALIDYYSDPNALLVLGYEVESITELLPSFEAPGASFAEASVYVKFGQYVLQSLGERPSFAFGSRVLHAMTTGKLQVSQTEFEVLTSNLADWKQAGFLFQSPPFQEGTGGRKMIAELFMKATKDCLLRHLFVLASGQVGLGPLATRVGDCISILYGSPTPIVLRPADTRVPASEPENPLGSRRCYQIVGQAYIKGMMFGEAVEQREAAGIQPQVMELV